MAEAQAEVIIQALETQIVTKADIAVLDKKMDLLVANLNGRLNLIQWMLAAVVAATVLPLLKGLF